MIGTDRSKALEMRSTENLERVSENTRARRANGIANQCAAHKRRLIDIERVAVTIRRDKGKWDADTCQVKNYPWKHERVWGQRILLYESTESGTGESK